MAASYRRKSAEGLLKRVQLFLLGQDRAKAKCSFLGPLWAFRCERQDQHFVPADLHDCTIHPQHFIIGHSRE